MVWGLGFWGKGLRFRGVAGIMRRVGALHTKVAEGAYQARLWALGSEVYTTTCAGRGEATHFQAFLGGRGNEKG